MEHSYSYDRGMAAVLYTVAARRSLRGLPTEVRRQIEAKLERYAATGAGDVRRLRHEDGARLRSGDYRVIFVETAGGIEVRAVGHRRDVYR